MKNRSTRYQNNIKNLHVSTIVFYTNKTNQDIGLLYEKTNEYPAVPAFDMQEWRLEGELIRSDGPAFIRDDVTQY